MYFTSNNTREQFTINKFLSDEKRKDINVTSLAKSLKDINTKTFDNTLVKLNIPQSTSDESKVKRLDYFERRLSREREEIEGFRVRIYFLFGESIYCNICYFNKLPPERLKQAVVTKGRFNQTIPSNSDQFLLDRELNKTGNGNFPKVFHSFLLHFFVSLLVHPDLYLIKEKAAKRLYIDPITKQTILN